MNFPKSVCAAAKWAFGLWLSVTITALAQNEGVNCTTYSSTDAPQAIGPGRTATSSTIIVPGHPRIQDLDVSITLNHVLLNQIDAHLRSPAENDNGLFTDTGSNFLGGQNLINLTLDDEAGIPFAFPVLTPVVVTPEPNYRLSWFDGEDAGGIWSLDLRDDVADTNGGTLTNWSMTICEQLPLTCPFGTSTIYSTDFEANNGGFTHDGTADEWARGLPATAATSTVNPVAAFTTCNSGVNCWKTDLTGTYEVNSNQDLFSPEIDLRGTQLPGPYVLSWAQRYQIDNATLDHAFVEVQEVGPLPLPPTPLSRQVWQWLDATMTSTVGALPAVNIGASAGWGTYMRDISDFAGKVIRVRFHFDSDDTIVLGGWAIDDVSIKACQGMGTQTTTTTTTPTLTTTRTATPTPTPTPTPAPTPPQNPRPTSTLGLTTLVNLSTRLQVCTGDRAMIAGLIIKGSSPKRVLIRALGPSLTAFGVPNVLANPRMELHDAINTIGTNDDWQTTIIGGVITSEQAAEISATGLAPTNAAESTIIATLPPGSYTAIIQGVGSANTGVASVEVYDIERNSGSVLANISTRGFVQTGDNVMIGGFIIVDQPTGVIIRAIGPSLIGSSVPDALANPQLELHDSIPNSPPIARNDDWETTQLGGIIGADQVQDILLSGIAPIGWAAESVIIAELQPGSYTVILRGINNTKGNALVEIYLRP